MKKLDWKELGWMSLKVLIVLVLLSPLIVLIVLYNVDFEDTGINYYLIMSNKKLVDLMHESGKILWYQYHWYWKFILWSCVILFSFVGNALFFKMLYSNKIKRKDIEIKDKQASALEKIAKKIVKDSENE